MMRLPALPLLVPLLFSFSTLPCSLHFPICSPTTPDSCRPELLPNVWHFLFCGFVSFSASHSLSLLSFTLFLCVILVSSFSRSLSFSRPPLLFALSLPSLFLSVSFHALLYPLLRSNEDRVVCFRCAKNTPRHLTLYLLLMKFLMDPSTSSIA